MNLLQDIDTKGNKYYATTATQAQAEAGTSETVLITPATLKYGVEALCNYSPNLDGGESNTNFGAAPTIDGGDVNGS